ncbi:MAG TPA: metal-sulfur cluster assembly factor [Propioniciclava tarda]|uniref:Metal-sulfur cluster assembly factor n=1 Tax=Propioniciclava tarda TaxID=433330 RepID=A0A4Q9KMT3_PROTD|nr:metal-sulfur cluster assembly factor [Propioniciclava tarda]TBT95290.1 metal-sulfur cluster assembly factor [Propioniciclava tarda]SMO60261.1 Metal-sulfur cluster biosynthetic enzyme [Propioniciclava tarda]HQA31720.1 metal-sulfur cluster assembly factor [Propioniciclava tarda]HQD61780.1 metal-sulfur cluster assembly factor [Propioniciclava tarda]
MSEPITSSLADAFGVTDEAPVVRTALDDDEPRPSSLVKDTLPGEFGSRVVPTQEDIVEAMREVIDPELGVNVVDLGMVADILIDDEANVIIDMVPTSPTCPMTDRLEYSAELATEGMVNSLAVNWLWLEVWTPARLTEDGREQLRAFGLNI